MNVSPQSLRKLDVCSGWALLIGACLLPIVIYFAVHMRIGAADVHAWLPEGRPVRQRYEEFVRIFGSDQYLVVSWDGCNVDDPRLSAMAKSLRRVDDQRSDSKRVAWIESLQTSDQLVRRLTDPPIALSREVAFDRLDSTIVGSDGTAAVFISFAPAGIESHKEAIELVRRAADDVFGLGRSRLKIVGSVFEAYAVDVAAEESLKRLVLPSSLLGVVLAWLCLSSIRAVLPVMLIAGIGQVLAIAIVTAFGSEFSAVLIVLPTLVFMLTLSAAVHFMNYFSDVARSHTDHLGARAVFLGLKPSILATLTTALGMIALATSQLSPVRNFGFYSAVSLCAASTTLILAFPRLSDWFCRSRYVSSKASVSPLEFTQQGHGETESVTPWAKSYASFMSRYCWPVSMGGILLLLFSFYGLLSLKSSTRFDDMFPPGSPTVSDMAWMENHLGPIASVEVLLMFPRDSSADAFDQLVWVDRVANHLRSQPDIGGLLAATSFLPKLPNSSRVRDVVRRRIFRNSLPEFLPQLQQQGLVSETADQRIWRITAKVSALSRLDYGQLTAKVQHAVGEIVRPHETTKEQLSAIDPQHANTGELVIPQVEFTGFSPMMHDTQTALLTDLGSSFTTAFFLITPVMMLIARGIRPGLLIMLPNVLPETVVFGCMAWLGYSLDVAGLLTASVAMGIAVNDTLHFVNWYSWRLSEGDTREEAIAHTFSNCARAMIHTMLISCCSMLPFMFAAFNPTRQFAMLMIAMMSTSILGDLVLLPALLLSPLGKWKKN
ncbi:MAG: MMPL family transporter [Planctomycetes bacterium]|nr:MMPL family transporter [Planctomycetota bacterium]